MVRDYKLFLFFVGEYHHPYFDVPVPARSPALNVFSSPSFAVGDQWELGFVLFRRSCLRKVGSRVRCEVRCASDCDSLLAIATGAKIAVRQTRSVSVPSSQSRFPYSFFFIGSVSTLAYNNNNRQQCYYNNQQQRIITRNNNVRITNLLSVPSVLMKVTSSLLKRISSSFTSLPHTFAMRKLRA